MAGFEAHNLVMGPGQKFLTGVESGQPFMVWVWIGKISPKNVKFLNFFLLQVKKNLLGSGWKVPRSKAGQPLIYSGSKVSSGWVRAHLYHNSSHRSHFSANALTFRSQQPLWIMAHDLMNMYETNIRKL